MHVLNEIPKFQNPFYAGFLRLCVRRWVISRFPLGIQVLRPDRIWFCRIILEIQVLTTKGPGFVTFLWVSSIQMLMNDGTWFRHLKVKAGFASSPFFKFCPARSLSPLPRSSLDSRRRIAHALSVILFLLRGLRNRLLPRFFFSKISYFCKVARFSISWRLLIPSLLQDLLHLAFVLFHPLGVRFITVQQLSGLCFGRSRSFSLGVMAFWAGVIGATCFRNLRSKGFGV